MTKLHVLYTNKKNYYRKRFSIVWLLWKKVNAENKL